MAWATLRKEREDARADKLKAEQDRLAREYQKAEQEYNAAVSNRQQARTWSISSAVLALGGFVLFGLILAVLAIERHTRVLEGAQQSFVNAAARAAGAST
jgi:hypothetical protein